MNRITRNTLLIAYSLIGAAFLLLVAEGVARLVIEEELEPLFSDPTLRIRGRPFVRPDPRRGFALTPGFDNGRYRIDQNGRRGDGVRSVPEGAMRISAFGDSATFGWRVRQGGDYPTQLETALGQRGRPDVLVSNAGVPSYSSSQVLLYLEESLEEEGSEPDLVLINVLWNDIYYSTVPDWYPELLISQQPDRWRALLLEHSKLLRRIFTGPPRRQGKWNIFNERPLAHYAANLDRMVDICRSAGVTVAFVEPAFSQSQMGTLGEFKIHYTRKFFVEVTKRYLAELAAVAERRDVPLLHHRLTLERIGDRDLAVQRFFADAIHPNAAGNYWIAEDLADALQDRKLLGPDR